MYAASNLRGRLSSGFPAHASYLIILFSLSFTVWLSDIHIIIRLALMQNPCFWFSFQYAKYTSRCNELALVHEASQNRVKPDVKGSHLTMLELQGRGLGV
jgi:hypothetical protein